MSAQTWLKASALVAVFVTSMQSIPAVAQSSTKPARDMAASPITVTIPGERSSPQVLLAKAQDETAAARPVAQTSATPQPQDATASNPSSGTLQHGDLALVAAFVMAGMIAIRRLSM